MVYITPYHATSFYALRGGHTDRHTDTHTDVQTNQNDFKKPGARGLWLCAPGLKINN